MRTAEDYRDCRQNLIPSGLIWSREPGKVISQVLEALGEEDARIEGRGADLIEEADPRTTTELLEDWERVAGIPGQCKPIGATEAERRQDLQDLLAEAGGQSRAYFVALGVDLGWPDIWIEDVYEFESGRARSGDAITNGDWVFVWKVLGIESVVAPFRSGLGRSGDRIVAWGDPVLECVFRSRAPAHTKPIFLYLASPTPAAVDLELEALTPTISTS